MARRHYRSHPFKCKVVLGVAESGEIRKCKNKKRAEDFAPALLSAFRPSPEAPGQSYYWLSGFSAMQASWAPGAAPLARKRTTASSTEQKLRLPVWLTTNGIAVATYCTFPVPEGVATKA